MTTALDIINISAKQAGVLAIGQTLTGDDSADILMLLNSMLAQWNQKRWLVYHLVDIACPSTGAQSYTVGPGAQFVVTRPARLEAAYARLTGEPAGSAGYLDYPLQLIQTREEYSMLSFKQLSTFPSFVFYDASFPTGTLYFWPVPSNMFELHIVLKETLPQFSGLTTALNLPPEYLDALIYSLSVRIQMLYNLPVNPALSAMAAASLNTVKVANSRVPELLMPAGLAREGGWSGHDMGGVVEGATTLDSDTLA